MTSIGEALPLQYVDFPTTTVLAPIVTPQTLVLDAFRRIVWRKQGTLDANDNVRAMESLAAMR